MSRLSPGGWIELRDRLLVDESENLKALGEAIRDAMFGRSAALELIWGTKHLPGSLLEAGRIERDRSLLDLYEEIAHGESYRRSARMIVERLARYRSMPANTGRAESRERQLIKRCIDCGANELSERSIRDRLAGGQTYPVATAQA